VAGVKTQARLERDGLIRPGRTRSSAIRSSTPPTPSATAPGGRSPTGGRWSSTTRTFRSDVSSWEPFGLELLRQFAGQSELNLVFAPHIRLFEGRRRRTDALRELAGSRRARTSTSTWAGRGPWT
jgi:hypothetical protein